MLPVLQLALSIQEQCLLLLVPSQNCNTAVLLNSIKQFNCNNNEEGGDGQNQKCNEYMCNGFGIQDAVDKKK